jgi:hypothetical protein
MHTLGAEERPTVDRGRCALVQVALQQLAGHVAEHHHTAAPVLGDLRPHRNLLVGEGEVPQRQCHQFAAPQCTVVGEEQHQPVAHRLDAGGQEDGLPFIVAWDPGQPLIMAEEAAIALACESPTRCEAPAPDRVLLSGPDPLVDEVPVQQTHHRQPLLHRRIREPYA